jgi:two-component system, LytTR family, response regulator
MLKAIAIDDEPMALEVIKAHAKKVTFLDLQGTFVSALEALDFLKANPIDLVFLDINMPDVTGLDFSQLLPQNTALIHNMQLMLSISMR